MAAGGAEVINTHSSGTYASKAPGRYEHHHQHYRQPPPPHPAPRDAVERDFREGPAPTMATAALMNPAAPYPGHPHSYASGYPHASMGPSIGGMMSPVEPPRPSADDNEGPPQQHRQSLPSISNILSSARSDYPPPTALTTNLPSGGPGAPASAAPASSLPSPYSATPRSYPDTPIEKGPSPRPLQQPTTAAPPPPPPPPPTYPPNQQSLPAFSGSPGSRQFGGGRPGPPPIVGPFSAPHPSSPTKLDTLHPESDKPPEPHHLNGGYPLPTPPVMPYQTAGPSPPGQLPPGQMPLLGPGYPVSPRHAGPPGHGHGPPGPPGHPVPPVPPLHSPYESQQTPRPEDDNGHGRVRYDTTMNRHFEAWGYQESLTRVSLPVLGSDGVGVLLFCTDFFFFNLTGGIGRENHLQLCGGLRVNCPGTAHCTTDSGAAANGKRDCDHAEEYRLRQTLAGNRPGIGAAERPERDARKAEGPL